MKYLAIFQLAGSESAASFTSKKAAEEFIKTCATLAKAKLTTLDDTYTLRTSRKNPIEITASVSPIDTTIEYQLTHDRDGATLDTTYYTTRRSAVSAAHKILDQLGFVAGSGEDEAGTWAVNNPLTISKISSSISMPNTIISKPPTQSPQILPLNPAARKDWLISASAWPFPQSVDC